MSRAPEVAPPRRPLALVLLVGAVLALVVPPMVTAGAEPWSGAVAILALALVALVRVSLQCVNVRSSAGAMPGSDDGPSPTLYGRVTDTPHHPVRPRAPGPA